MDGPVVVAEVAVRRPTRENENVVADFVLAITKADAIGLQRLGGSPSFGASKVASIMISPSTTLTNVVESWVIAMGLQRRGSVGARAYRA
jgi:hypothetical protein